MLVSLFLSGLAFAAPREMNNPPRWMQFVDAGGFPYFYDDNNISADGDKVRASVRDNQGAFLYSVTLDCATNHYRIVKVQGGDDSWSEMARRDGSASPNEQSMMGLLQRAVCGKYRGTYAPRKPPAERLKEAIQFYNVNPSPAEIESVLRLMNKPVAPDIMDHQRLFGSLWQFSVTPQMLSSMRKCVEQESAWQNAHFQTELADAERYPTNTEVQAHRAEAQSHMKGIQVAARAACVSRVHYALGQMAGQLDADYVLPLLKDISPSGIKQLQSYLGLGHDEFIANIPVPQSPISLPNNMKVASYANDWVIATPFISLPDWAQKAVFGRAYHAPCEDIAGVTKCDPL
jgi:hypothetical protein